MSNDKCVQRLYRKFFSLLMLNQQYCPDHTPLLIQLCVCMTLLF